MSINDRLSKVISEKVAARVKDFQGRVAQAGFFPDAAYPDGTPVAYVAAIQEYGDPSHKIPPRSSIRGAIGKHRAEWTEDMKRGVRAALHGDASATAVLDQVGAAMAADIQVEIAATQTPKLSDITVMLRGMRRNDPGLVVSGKTVGEAARRVAEGKTNYGASDKPLVDSGLLLASVTSKTGKAE